MMMMRNIDCEFKNAQDFYDVYQTLPSWQKNLLCELYLHNFIIPQETKWNPLLYIGDVHLRALMSRYTMKPIMIDSWILIDTLKDMSHCHSELSPIGLMTS